MHNIFSQVGDFILVRGGVFFCLEETEDEFTSHLQSMQVSSLLVFVGESLESQAGFICNKTFLIWVAAWL